MYVCVGHRSMYRALRNTFRIPLYDTLYILHTLGPVHVLSFKKLKYIIKIIDHWITVSRTVLCFTTSSPQPILAPSGHTQNRINTMTVADL